METNENDLWSLYKTLGILKPYLKEIVIVGGWVPFLYRKYGRIPSRHPSIRTRDIDIAVPTRLDEGNRPTIDELLSGAGYKTHIYGADFSVVKYELSLPEVELEFITPEIGRPGKPVITIQRGLTAQALRYLQILLENTMEIAIRDTLSGSDINLDIKVPSPGAFIFQKVLTLSRRQSKVAKDLYYIFDLLDSSSKVRDSILREIDQLRTLYVHRWFQSFLKNLNTYFPEVAAEGAVLIASQYNGPMPIDTFRNYVKRIFRDFIRDLG
jgi:hypothetical protein